MAKKHEPKPSGQWTTQEELLLAYAVKRHGSGSWDAIAKELQSRVPMQRNYVSSVITPQNCRDEFLRLRHRFTPLDSTAAEEEEEEESCLVPMLDELRRIRIEELRREVKRHDVSIVSLESKIKRLEKDREQSLAEETDLRGQASEREETKASPAIIAGESSATAAEAVPADESDDRSFNESNSIGQKPELATASRVTKNDAVKDRIPPSAKREPAGETGTISVQTRTEPDRDRDSSSRFRNADNDADKRSGGGTDAKAAAVEVGQAAKATRATRLGESNEFRDSLSESKREGASSKQSSDVQSSASLSRIKGRRKARAAARAAGSTSSGEEEPEADEVSPATQKRAVAVKPPEPLVDLLRRIRSHRLGSAFERRLRIQESERYRSLIRQRMDLRIIQSRLERGAYSDCFTKFYRDLLLLFNNAIVFHRKTSSDYTAAVELRALVTKAMKARLRNRTPASAAAPSKSKPLKRPPPEPVASLKSKPSKPVIGACGKRSSAKPATGKTNRGREIEEKKPDVVVKENKDVGRNGGSVNVSGKLRKERSGNHNNSNKNTGAKNSRPTMTKKESNSIGETKKHAYGNNELSSHDTPVSKPVAKNTNAKKNVKKKQGVVSFLRRMKQSVSSDSDSDGDVDADADAERDVSGSEGEEEKEEKARNRGKRKEGVATRSVSSSLPAGKGGKEEKEKGKKNTARPVRKAAATATATAAAGETTGKRERESNREGSGGGARAKKRVRR